MDNFVESSLHEKDVRELLGIPRKTLWLTLKHFFKYAVIFSLIFAAIFTLANGPALWQKLKYFWKTEYKNQPYSNYPNINANNSQQVFLPDIGNIPSSTQVSLNELKIENNHLMIVKINVDAPIVWQVDENNILANLKNGVVHYKGTALPGQNGNIFITGHSSNYWWEKGNYNHVFALLPQMVVGDIIIINYNNTKYAYRVSNVFEVKPSQLSVLAPTPTPILTLMTCVPVGTTLRRLIVQADQIWPSASESTAPVLELPFLNP